MWVNINTDSIGTSIGAIMIFTFTIYFLVSYLFVKKDRLNLILSLMLLSLLMYMGGYSIYASSIDVVKVLFWTRICYLGAASVILTAYLLTSEIINSYSKTLNFFTAIYFLVMAVVIYMPNELMFKSVLKSGKSHSSVVKGPLFVYFVLLLLVISIFLLTRFIRILSRDRKKVHLVAPILFAMVFWLIEGAVYGILGAVLSVVPLQLSLGPIILTLCFALYSARISNLLDLELTEVKEEREEIYKNLIYDKLSGLFTREYFLEGIEQIIALKNRKDTTGTILFIDIDNFKPVNDELGHYYGDELIKLIGEVMRKNSRKSDVCSRFGGDEFMMLLNNSPLEESERIANNINREFKESLEPLLGFWKGYKKISLSIGVLYSDDWLENAEETIHRVDKVMYRAKNSGKNSTVHYID